ncbi:mechanosensitive ion channel [Limibaculum sp. M0105]|uniref:Mechanosensitive ion channel n=1 Tax=Thermohalobaculum xanthum TaxID=2753746 RepID=A0A8J7M6S8_9RHOB|nr:mechanosensitive ion channel domain-containing protein [Thermohalobaculum xanthum]MBK0399641.1 mechanosensitive ion channel [Thermohalobaculum xanthum]
MTRIERQPLRMPFLKQTARVFMNTIARLGSMPGLIPFIFLGLAVLSASPAAPQIAAPQVEAPVREPEIPEGARVQQDPSSTSNAQANEPGQAAPATGTTPESAPASAESVISEARALIAILRDATARDRLIAELERLAGETDGSAPTSAAADAPATPTGGPSQRPAVNRGKSDASAEDPPIGRRIAEVTHEAMTSVMARAQEVYRGLRATQRRLSGLANTNVDELLSAMEAVGIALAIATGIRAILWGPVQWCRRRLGAIASRTGPLRRVVTDAAALVVDAIALIVSAATGAFTTIAYLGQRLDIELHQALFLNSFIMVGLGCVVLRAILSPKVEGLRIAPMGSATAHYWMRWGGLLIAFLGYGLLLVVPLVNETVNIFTGRAVAVVVYAIFLLSAMALVIRNRRVPREYYEKRAEESGGDVTLTIIAHAARYWHIAVVIYLLTLFSAAVRQSGNVGPMLVATAKIAAAAALGAFVMAVLGRISARGLKLPSGVNERLPLLERRINTFVPAFLNVVRFVMMVMVVAFSLHTMGVADLEAWLEGSFGVDIAETLISASVIVLAGFAVWLALTSWVDYRMTPRRGRRVTSREQTLLSLLRNAATIAIAVFTLMFVLSDIGIDIAPLIASAGVLGLAIGFGAQKMVQDIITGIFIQFESAINVGDVVTLAGTTGTVEKLTIRSVSLRDVHGVFHIIPFSSVDAVSNYMRGFSYHVADIGIAYREDIDEAKALMIEAFETLRSDPEQGNKILGDLEWFGVQQLGDSAVVLRARIKTRPGDQWSMGRAYNEAVKKRFDQAGVEIPFPHMTIWFGENRDGSAPPAQLALADRGLTRALVEPSPAARSDTKRARPKAAKPTEDAPLGDDGDEN